MSCFTFCYENKTRIINLFFTERENERMEEKRQRIEERKQKEATSTTEASTAPTSTEETAAGANEEDNFIHDVEPKKGLKIEVHATATHHHQQLDPVQSHAQAHDFSHNQAVS